MFVPLITCMTLPTSAVVGLYPVNVITFAVTLVVMVELSMATWTAPFAFCE